MMEFLETLYKTMEAVNEDSRRILEKGATGPASMEALRNNGILLALGMMIFDKEKTGG